MGRAACQAGSAGVRSRQKASLGEVNGRRGESSRARQGDCYCKGAFGVRARVTVKVAVRDEAIADFGMRNAEFWDNWDRRGVKEKVAE